MDREQVLKALEAAREFIAPMAKPQETYGYFPGGDYDPRTFNPDEDCSTPEEITAHKAAVEAWDRGERPEIKSSFGRLEERGGEVVKHPCGSALGVGSYFYVDDDVAELLAQIDEAIAAMGPA